MISNLILIVIAILSLFFIGLLWLRQDLLSSARHAEHILDILKKDLQKRRDTVPYLLESTRQVEEPKDTWRSIVSARAFFHTSEDLNKEMEFETMLMTFIASCNIKTVNFLEAKKDITDLNMLIGEQRQELSVAKTKFNELSTKFPHILASKIFGLPPSRS